MKRCLSIIVSFSILLVLVAAADYNRPILGPEVWPDPDGQAGEELLAFNKPDRFYENEYTGLMFFTKDGWKFVSNLFYFKLGPQLKWGISVSAADNDNNYYLGKAEIDSSKVKFNPKSVEVAFGESFIKGKNPNYHVHYVTDNVTVDLHLKSWVGIWAHNTNGKFTFGPNDKFFVHTAFAAPWADVTGSIIVDGKTHKIDGQGYMDHGHWSVPFNRHFPIWEGFLAWTWEPVDGHRWAIMMWDYVMHPAYGGKRLATGFAIKDDKFACTTPKFKVIASDFRRDERTGLEFPWRYDARTMPDAPCVMEGVSKAEVAWEILDIFDELPPYIRPIAKKFLKRPVYFRAFGKFKGRIRCGDEEVSLDVPVFHDANYVR